MTEETTQVMTSGYASIEPIPETLPQPKPHNHDHTVPVTISDDSVAVINVAAEEAELEPYKRQYIKEKRKHVTIQGFRKGHAPEEMVARFFKAEARLNARDNVIYNKYMKLLQEHKLQPLSQPRLDHIHDDEGSITANFIVDVLQPVVLGQYLGLELDKMPVRNADADLDKTLAEIKQSYPKLVDVDSGVVGKDNVVVVDFVVTDNGKELEKQDNFKISIGKNLYYLPFEEQLIGMKVDENKEFDIHFPETYHKEDFKGKVMHFNLTVRGVKTVSDYTDDELAKVLGYEEGAKMLTAISNQIVAKHKDEEHYYYENQILGQLLSAHQFKIPHLLIEQETNKIRTEHPEMMPEQIVETADRFVRTDLVLHAIYERHPEIQLDQEQFNAKVAELAARANDTVEATMQKLQTAGKLQSFVNYLTNCKVIDFLIEMADVQEPKTKIEVPEEETTLTQEKENG